MIFGQFFIEKENKEVFRINNNIHPLFKQNLLRFVQGDVYGSSLSSSTNWQIDRFYFYENKVDFLSGTTTTGVSIATKTATTYSTSGQILTIKMDYTVSTSKVIASIALACPAMIVAYAQIPQISARYTQEYLKLQLGEEITLGWQLDFNK